MPIHAAGTGERRKLNVEVLDLPSLTPQAVLVALYECAAGDQREHRRDQLPRDRHHRSGRYPPSPLDVWASAGDATARVALMAAMLAGDQLRAALLQRRPAGLGARRSISTSRPFPGAFRWNWSRPGWSQATLSTPATPWWWRQLAPLAAAGAQRAHSRQAAGTARRGNLRLLVSDAGTLDRTLDQPRTSSRPRIWRRVLAQARNQHAADRIYVSLLVPETQAGMEGQTLSSLPLSVANALEPLRSAQDVSLNGESAEVAGGSACRWGVERISDSESAH